MAAKKKPLQPSLLSFFSTKVVEKASTAEQVRQRAVAASSSAADVTNTSLQAQSTNEEAQQHAATPGVNAADVASASSLQQPYHFKTPRDVTSSFSHAEAGGGSKHASRFNKSWLRDHPWLLFDDHDIKGGMLCKLCRKYDKRPFDKPVWNEEPCKRIRLESVRKHETSYSHRDSVALEALSNEAASPLEALQAPVSRGAMQKAFASLYYLCKRRIAHTTNYEPLLDLLTFLGLNVKDQMAAGKNATYCSQRAIKEMVTCLSSVIEDKILRELKQSEHYALMFDETTDCTTVEQLVIHCRYIFDGTLQVKFLAMIDVLGSLGEQLNEERTISLNAANIAGAVEDFIGKKGLAFDCLRGIGTDGAPIMTGRKGGAVKLLKDRQRAVTAPECTQAVGVHCGAHKLNLAANHAAKAVPYIGKFKELLQHLYSFYASSPVRTAGLSAVQKVLDTQGGGGKITGSSATRWLSVGGSCAAVRNNLPSILVSLSREAEERSDIKAAGLHKFVSDKKFIGTLLMMCEVLPSVDRLSKMLQSKSLHVGLLQGLIKSTIKTLEAQKNIQTQVQVFCEANDIPFAPTQDYEEWLRATKSTFLDKLTENIKDRFQDDTILAAFSVLFARGSYEEAVSGNGVEIADALGKLCCTLGKSYTSDMMEEWRSFANFVLVCEKLQKLTESEFLLHVATGMKELFPLVAHIAGAYLVLPPHTADCERDFSALKLIKTQLRNRLKEESLDALIRIACEGPEVEEYPYDKVVENWAKLKNRRLKV